MTALALSDLVGSLHRAILRQNPFTQIDASGDSRSASRQLPLILGCQAFRLPVFGLTAYVLTRLIEPQEFGRLLMVGVPVALVNLFGDFGLGDGVVRSKEIDAPLASFFFWTNLAVGLAASAMLIVLLPVFEEWFGGVRLFGLGLSFVVVIVLGSAIAQYRALLRRQLRLATLSLSEVGVTIAASSSSVIAAAADLGALAVPIGRGVGLVLELVFLVHLSGWLPGRISAFSRARPVLAFGWRLALSGVFHFGVTAAANLVLGRYFSTESLGLVERATELSRGVLARFDHVIRRVTYPLLARRAQADAEGGRKLASRMVRASIFVWVVPGCVLAGLMPSLVQVLLGAEWQGLGEFLGWGWIGLSLWLPLSMATAMLLANGHSGLLVYTNAALFIFQMVIVALGVTFGLGLYVCLAGLFGVVFGLVQLGLLGWRCQTDWIDWIVLAMLQLGLGGTLALVLLPGMVLDLSPLATLVAGFVIILLWSLAVGFISGEIRSALSAFIGAFSRAA